MTKNRSTGRGKAKRPAPSKRGSLLKPAAVAAVTVAVLGAVLFYAFSGSGTDAQVARPGADASTGDGSIRVLNGSQHRVQHSTLPLPSGAQPRSDGMPTLVWFSGTWCHFCHEMEPFAYDTAATFADRVHFVEKSVDHDRDAAGRYGVRGTPTFVLIDATGEEIARFGFQRTPEAFAAVIEQALGQSQS